ncbi:hypothetical protein GF386_06195 [Candidatus Pacearchaeota archaeon]|nr:hypothetical protein [Candidatus Pacearchaeota archaeon]MBD3283680.1 hypothetical protein [Candidatus Pacearchaeota archaeon]
MGDILSYLKEFFSFTTSLPPDSTLAKILPPEMVSGVNSLFIIFKALGIVFFVYILILIIQSFFNIRRNIRINRMYHKVNDIEKKIDVLIGKEKSKEKNKKAKIDEITEKVEEKHEKKSFLKGLLKKNRKKEKKKNQSKSQ